MTFRENLAVLRERWVLVLVTVALAMGAAAAVWALRPVRYTATLTLYVSAQTADPAQTGLLSQQRVKSYIELIRSVPLSEQVVADLRLPLTAEQVAAKIDATSPPDSVLIDLGVTDPDARQATAIVNGVSAAIVRLVDELERPAAPNTVPSVAVRIVRPASVPSQPSSPDLPVMLALGLLGGLVLGAGAAMARHLLDTTVKSAEQLTALAKAPNLTTIGYDGAVRKTPAHRARAAGRPARRGVPAAAHQPAVRRPRQPPQGHRRDQPAARGGQDHHHAEPGHRAGLRRPEGAGRRGGPATSRRRAAARPGRAPSASPAC